MGKSLNGMFFGIKRMLLFSIIFVFFLLMISTGCTKQKTFEEKVIEQKNTVKQSELAISIPDSIHSLDPLEVNNPWELQVVGNLYEGVVGYNWVMKKIEPALAKEWSVSKDGLIYTFTLRDQAFFHSGKQVTAEDIKASWERAMQKPKGETWHIFKNVSGFEQYSKGKNNDVIGLEVLNDNKLQVTLNVPDELFLLKLSHLAAAIVDVEYIQAAGLDYGIVGTQDVPTRVNGTGPYALVEWFAHQNITLEAFKKYPSKSQFARVEFHLNSDADMALAELQRGSVNIIRCDSKLPGILLVRDPNLLERQIKQPRAEIYYLGFNVQKGITKEQSIRQAISYAINRKELVGEGEIKREAKRLLPQVIVDSYSSLTQYVFDQELAKRLLGFTADDSGIKRDVLTLYFVKDKNAEELAKKIAGDLEKVGLNVRIQSLDTYQELHNGLKAGSITFYLNKWLGSDEEVGFFLVPLFLSTSPYNVFGYKNSQVDELLRFIQTQKPFSKEYMDAVLQAEKLVMEDFPIITLLECQDSVFVNELVTETGVNSIRGIEIEKVRLE